MDSLPNISITIKNGIVTEYCLENFFSGDLSKPILLVKRLGDDKFFIQRLREVNKRGKFHDITAGMQDQPEAKDILIKGFSATNLTEESAK